MSEMMEDQETASEQGNAGRRRLVRGAVALAPVVLTLRSGALAAAVSCTGVKVLGVQTDENGMFKALPEVETTDYCAIPVQTCGQNKISGANIDPEPITGPFETANGPRFQCGASGQRTVAILSSASVTSLRPL